MKIEHSFEVEAPIDEVWAALTDVPRVAPCLPGADITEKQDDGSYTGTFTVKLGPTTAAYRGTLRMQDLDEANHTATMRGDGTDKRGQGGVKATVVSKMREEGGVTHVDIDTDLNITGRLARFGRGGMVQDVSTKLLDRFAECLKSELTSDGGASGGGAAGAPGGASATAAAGNGAEEGAAAPETPGEDAPAATAAESGSPAAGPEAAGETATAAASNGEPASAGATDAPSGGASSAPRPAAEPFDAGAIAGEVMAERAKRAGPVIVALLVLLWLLRRRG